MESVDLSMCPRDLDISRSHSKKIKDNGVGEMEVTPDCKI